MRKQNSIFHTAFLSEAGSELENNDYFAFVELEQYACYVIADGLNELSDAKSAKLAIETALVAFQEHPSLKRNALLSYIKAANQELCKADSREHLKASVTIVVSNYEKIRYVYAGNTRLRFYRNGIVKEQSEDTSLSNDINKKEKLPEDRLLKHEERNNLYSYVGQGNGFIPVVSHKMKLENGDILTLYTRGIWENLDSGELDDVFSEAKDKPKESLDQIEDLLLSRQPKVLENYTFAVIFVDKIFLDPQRKKKRKKIVIFSVIVFVILLAVFFIIWFLRCRYNRMVEEMERKYQNTIEYMQDHNFIKAEEEGNVALEYSEKLRDKKLIQQISDYLKLIEAVNIADENYQSGKYEEAQNNYITAKERSRYADHIADNYIDQRLENIVAYRSVFDYIQLGDTLMEQEDYDRAEKKYLQAKKMATGIYFEDGRKEAMDALEKLYTKRKEVEAAKEQEAMEQKAVQEEEANQHVITEISAVQFTTEGDQAFAKGDYNSAKAYYHMALEKYQELEDEVHIEWILEKIEATSKKGEELEEKIQQAVGYQTVGKEQEMAGNRLEAKKQYLFAKNLYRELGMDTKVLEIDGWIALLELEETQENLEMQETSKIQETPESIQDSKMQETLESIQEILETKEMEKEQVEE